MDCSVLLCLGEGHYDRVLAIRRLLEAFQPMLSVEGKTQIPLMAYPRSGKKYVSLAWPEAHEHFDLTRPKRISKPLRDTCNLIIHSYVFAPRFESGRLTGVFFTSDRQKERELYLLRVEDIARLFRDIGTGRGKWRMRFAPDINRFEM